MDLDVTYDISPDEINRYIKLKRIPLDTPETGNKLFDEITAKRTVAHKTQLKKGLTLQEIIAAV